MKTVLLAIGVVVALMFTLGSIGAADFYLCFKPVGECIRP